MRIGYLYEFVAFPPRGGNQLHAYQLIRQFQALGHEVFTVGDPSVPGVNSLPKGRPGIEAISSECDVLYQRVDGNPLGRSPDLVRELERTQKPLVWEINAPANEDLAFSWLGGRRIPPRHSIGWWLDRARRTVHAARKIPKIHREERLRRRLAKRVKASICVSSALARYSKEGLGIEDTLALPNGSDPELNHPGRAPAPLPAELDNHLKVLYAGSPIYPWQGIDILTDTISLHRAKSDVPILFILLVNQLSDSIPVGENCLTVESVPYEEVGSYIAAVDVCLTIHPEYFWSPWKFHGSPMKLFDYMACGKPVLCSRVGQMGELIKESENGFLFDNTPEDLLRKLEELHTRPHLLEPVGTQAREDVLTRFNWRRIAEETLEVFERVTSRP